MPIAVSFQLSLTRFLNFQDQIAEMTLQRWLTPFKTITALMALIALGTQLYLLIHNTPENGMTVLEAIGRFLIFFTVLSNLLVAMSLLISLLFPKTVAGVFVNQPQNIAAVAFYIFIVGLIYNLILRNLWNPHGLQLVADELLHVVVPILYTIYWLVFGKKGFLKWKHPFQWLVFPAVYLVYAMLRGAKEGFYAYPFINLAELGYSQVLMNCAGLLLVFIIIGLVFVAADKMISNQRRKN